MAQEDRQELLQDIDVAGDNYGNFTQTGNINQYIQQEELDFEDINLQDLELRFKDSPEIKLDLCDRIKKERLLVLGEIPGINQDELALNLAFILRKNIGSASIRQWRRSSSQQILDLEKELQSRESTTIFVVINVGPNDFGLDIIDKADKLQKHYVLISTHLSFQRWSWYLGEKARKVFPELKEQDVYSVSEIKNYLNKSLNDLDLLSESNKIRMPDNFSPELVANQLKTKENVSQFVYLLKDELQRIPRITQSKNSTKQGQVDIEELINIATSNEKFIRNLYHKILEPREQLIALGLSFFNGLFEDQLFAALEQVVQKVWEKRDPSLLTLDYYDFNKLQDKYFTLEKMIYPEGRSEYFKVIKTPKDYKINYKIEVRLIKITSDDRKMLFKVAWESHQRQIVTALNVLVDLVKKSVVKKQSYRQGELELYGDDRRGKRLRNIITETLSDIGLVSTRALSAVQGSLQELAIDSNKEVRSVAANAIARWYDPSNRDEEKLFRTMQKFYSVTLDKEKESRDKESKIESEDKKGKAESRDKESKTESKDKKGKTESRDKESKTKSKDKKGKTESKGKKANGDNKELEEKREDPDYYNIGATVAVTVSSAIYKYHDRNELSNQFYDWLEELLKSQLNQVYKELGYNTLPWIVPLYLKQAQMPLMLKNIAKTNRAWHKIGQKNLSIMIANSLAQAWFKDRDNRDKVRKLLDDWYLECCNNMSNPLNGGTDSEYNALLKTVALTYGLIDYNKNGPLAVEDAFCRLDEILEKTDQIVKNRDKYAVRDAVVNYSICSKLLYPYFQRIESHLANILLKFTSAENKRLIESLKYTYTKQREKLEEDDNFVASLYSDIPLTDVEKAMFSWIQNDSNDKAQKIAVHALIAFIRELNQSGKCVSFTKQMQALVANFAEDRRSEIAKRLKEIYLEEDVLNKSDYLLKIIIIIYKAIVDNQLSIELAFNQLWDIFFREQDPSVHDTTIIAIRLLADHYFEQLQTLVSQLEYQRQELIEILVQINRDQRAKLKEIYSDSPLTDIEKTMFSWIKDSTNPIAQRLALQASVEFATN